MISFFDDFEKLEEVDKKSTSLLKEKEEKEEKEEISINDVVSDVNELKKSLNDVHELVKLLVDNKVVESDSGRNPDNN